MTLATRKFEDIITFSRASAATYWDANGVLQTAAVDEPRLDHDPLTGTPLGILIEEQRTNEIFVSDGQASDYATKDNVSDANGPVPWLSNGILFDNQGGTVVSFAYRDSSNHTPFVQGDVVVMIAVIRMADGGEPVVASGSGDGSGDFVPLMNTGTAGPTIDLKPLGDGGWILTAIASVPGSPSNRYGLVKYAGNSNKSFTAQVIQLEKGLYPTSYIPTSGGAATRSRDVARAEGAQDWLLESEFTALIKCKPVMKGAAGSPFLLTDGGNRRIFYRAGGVEVNVSSYDGSTIVSGPSGLSLGEDNKLGFSVRPDSQVVIAINGTSATRLAPNGLSFSSFNVLDLFATESGWISSLQVFKHAMDAEELEGLTS
ncbi:hypothetical protein [Marinobacter sp. Hex_13]|uniref:phage head spike fiber domain-containing protein n=1 Tax=Marinobacter sp. Hex_13 TaxID=1795866 RepID=UPI00079723D7|nr:hypothetical protein [Marinobacter sp. Hex_13]KXJ45901.1 MAG: hypothetical protein AXW11_12490 [Marinobacter sp. Hex_13]